MSAETSIACAIMAHPQRRDLAFDLADRLANGEHDELPGFISMDIAGEGEIVNGLRAWALAASVADDLGCSWCVVLQDDAEPIHDFQQQARLALAHAPQTAVSFYVGAGRPRQTLVREAIDLATMRRAAWLEHRDLLWGVAVAMPTAHVAGFLAWARREGGGDTPRPRSYDLLIGAYWRQQGIPVRYTWPSLVDHDDRTPSLLGNDRTPSSGPRVAHYVGVPERWDTPAVTIR